MKKPVIIIHACCGPCGGGVFEAATNDGNDATAFFSNSNIYPKEEYDKRLSAAEELCRSLGIKLVSDEYDHDDWKDYIKGTESEAEGGKRCEKCFEYRLMRTAAFARDNSLPFSTTLAVSPYKNEIVVNKAGEVAAEMTGATFIPITNRKREIWKESVRISKELGIYRQKYCGCEFSIKKTQ
jgi:hypothetical protein